MDAGRFAGTTRALGLAWARRPILGLLAGSTTGILGMAKSSARKKKKKKKVTLCLNGQTIKVPKKKQKNYLSQGATPGTCAPSPPCRASCTGKPCGTDDGCGGTCGCPAGQLCQAGTCHTCDVTCSGSAAQCGAALQEKISQGGIIYICPGRYAGQLSLDSNVTLIGAGRGDDPTTSTILDGLQAKRVLSVEETVTASLEEVHITGGKRDGFGGGGVLNFGALIMTRCTVTKNTVTNASGGGISQDSSATGGITLTDCTISANEAGNHGGGLMQFDAAHQVTLTNCIVSGNHAGTDGTGNGGGLACSEGALRMTGGSLTNNSAPVGGGIWASATDTDAAVAGVAMSGNTPPNCVNVVGCS